MSEQCPKCGAEQKLVIKCVTPAKLYACGTRKMTHGSVFYRAGEIIESEACLRNQLAQARERIAELEAELDMLKRHSPAGEDTGL